MKRNYLSIIAVINLTAIILCLCSGCSSNLNGFNRTSTIKVYDSITKKSADLTLSYSVSESDVGFIINDVQSSILFTIYEIFEDVKENNPYYNVKMFNSENILIETNNPSCPIILITAEVEDNWSGKGRSSVVITAEAFDGLTTYSTFGNYNGYADIYFPLHFTSHRFSYTRETIKDNFINPFYQSVELWGDNVYMLDDLFYYYDSFPRYKVESDGKSSINVTDKETGFAFRINYDKTNNTMKYSERIDSGTN